MGSDDRRLNRRARKRKFLGNRFTNVSSANANDNASFTPFLDIIKIFSKTFNSHFEPLIVLAIK